MLRLVITALLISLTIGAQATTNTQTFTAGMQALKRGNYAEAYCHWKPLAEFGHAESQYHLGWLYANGNGMYIDIQQAHRWWRAAAMQNHTDAQFAIGLSYINGEGVKQDIPKASKWFLLAARQDHQDARDILMRFSSDPNFDVISANPALIHETWFGQQGIIVAKVANVRRAASTKSEIVAQLPQNTRIKIIGQTGNWVRIVLAKAGSLHAAWVYKTLTKPVDNRTSE